jgi:hypothetical protein
VSKKIDRTVVRNQSFIKSGIGIRERHNERENEMYNNPDIVLERSRMNVHYKECETTYGKWFDTMIESGVVSTRGLKPDAKVFGELVFDVNTMYFENHGGYEFAKQFYEEAYHYAEKKIGNDYIVSAVMHADEIHRGILDDTGQEVYHYHLHVMYIPVVEKEIKWSKRCRDKSLVGTTKEVINQISNSKKWAFVPAIDDNGKPVVGKNGKKVMIPSYAILQDEFYNHMVETGFKDFERGKRGSTAEHLSIVEYKVQHSNERLGALEDKIVQKIETLGAIDNEIVMKEESLDRVAEKYDEIEKVEVRAEQVSRVGQLTSDGSYLLTERQHMVLTNMAREGLYARTKIGKLQEQITDLMEKLNLVLGKLAELHEKTQDFTIAMRFAPKRIKAVINDILARNKIKADLMRHRPMSPLFKGVQKERSVRGRGMER